ncbi:hypothetical protein VNO77_40226 [Canavalia gladiata]|uniref:Uncharacterized protein n=1 Tax=Canavalia gladiata TaxID=3824 RepID=A0AAN9PPH4_CANGL
MHCCNMATIGLSSVILQGIILSHHGGCGFGMVRSESLCINLHSRHCILYSLFFILYVKKNKGLAFGHMGLNKTKGRTEVQSSEKQSFGRIQGIWILSLLGE